MFVKTAICYISVIIQYLATLSNPIFRRRRRTRWRDVKGENPLIKAGLPEPVRWSHDRAGAGIGASPLEYGRAQFFIAAAAAVTSASAESQASC